jgi:hypothetical protein
MTLMALYKNFILLFFLLGAKVIVGQEISISSDLNIRSYFSYDILGEINDRVLIYRDKGFVQEIDVFNEDLEHTQYAELTFEEKKVDVFNVMALDTMFQVLYGYFENDTMLFKMRRYDHKITVLDTATIGRIPKISIRKRITPIVSEDKSKILLYTFDAEENFFFYIFDNKSKTIAWQLKIKIQDCNPRRDIHKIVLTDDGNFFIILNNPEKVGADEAPLRLLFFYPAVNSYKNTYIVFNDIVRKDIHIAYDNYNDRIKIVGTYAEKRGKEVKGYYLLNRKLSMLADYETVDAITFSEELVYELLQGKKKKNNLFDDLWVKEVIHRQDGGLLILSEIQREFSRRNPYNNAYSRSTYDGYSRRGWVDYYNEDIIISNIGPDNSEDWTKVLYKKQFSQDDEAVFSSFFTLKTPSRMRIIYNDEIKKSNTVSEYLMDPLGQLARNSLMSTEYQNMKLRFKDAMQISSNAILVPSEKNYNLNLVKISY